MFSHRVERKLVSINVIFDKRPDVCFAGLTSTSAYHLLYLLHHINGSVLQRLLLIYETIYELGGCDGLGYRLDSAIFSALTSAYTASSFHPAHFHLYAEYQSFQDQFPPRAENFLPAGILKCAYLWLDATKMRWLDEVLEWVTSSLCAHHSDKPIPGMVDLITLFGPRHCQRMYFGFNRDRLDGH